MPDPTHIQLRVLELAKAEGKDIRSLTEEEYTAYAVRVRNIPTLIQDGASRMVSVGLHSLGLRRVSLQQAAKVRGICESNQCGAFSRLADGVSVCLACDCSGTALEAKQADAAWYCPKGLWDNRTEEAQHA